MSATTHPVSLEELTAHLDGELPADRAPAIVLHLAECLACREQVLGFRSLSDKFHSWPTESLSTAVEERILSAQFQISVPAAALYRVIRFPHWSWKRWTLMAVASGCAVLLLMAIALPIFTALRWRRVRLLKRVDSERKRLANYSTSHQTALTLASLSNSRLRTR